MIKVITIEREYGSQGAEFAHRLADEAELEAHRSMSDR